MVSDPSWIAIKRKLKTLVAGVIFTTMFVGAATAAFAGLAASVSALGGAVSQPSTSVTAMANPVPETSPSYGANSGSDSWVTPDFSSSAPASVNITPSNGSTNYGQGGIGSVDGPISQALDRMQSPLGNAVDSGGAFLGNRVQNGFGQMLASIIKTLFLEQPDPSSTQMGG
ncbi:hypothetical protein ACOJUR_11435 [Alicyclobacillus tolerans]|uniref:Uncharacterized protein n=2 Tax=Alicyclobacillus tolerans TaxID=90970 RepID=A0A1M6JYM0_9BACL|nr:MULTISPECIES: hypothetical protein [Alicyclobacillus]MDP9727364.1 hypothetical protein [Alicyclobacillus tengchongensis]QRF23104.1 hypothetical protein FY534_04985 [Alicyclobacillus sp. TC]SHJ51731.1 hypothetical protein SAMN05443507_10191 [Alicyclobacillus montanus]